MSPTRAICVILLAVAAESLLAGEVAIDPSDNGVDILEDTTEDTDSRSSEVAVAAEHLLGPPITEVEAGEPVVPLADAVTAAAGLAVPITVLGIEVAPGTTQRLSWSATELFERRNRHTNCQRTGFPPRIALPA
jgi:hypothetical protein